MQNIFKINVDKSSRVICQTALVCDNQFNSLRMQAATSTNISYAYVGLLRDLGTYNPANSNIAIYSHETSQDKLPEA